jgi:hypothetical protein
VRLSKVNPSTCTPPAHLPLCPLLPAPLHVAATAANITTRQPTPTYSRTRIAPTCPPSTPPTVPAAASTHCVLPPLSGCSGCCHNHKHTPSNTSTNLQPC